VSVFIDILQTIVNSGTSYVSCWEPAIVAAVEQYYHNIIQFKSWSVGPWSVSKLYPTRKRLHFNTGSVLHLNNMHWLPFLISFINQYHFMGSGVLQWGMTVVGLITSIYINHLYSQSSSSGQLTCKVKN